MDTLPDYLKTCREQAHLSRSAVADAVGVTVASVGHWERGYRQPTLATLKRLAALYSVDLGDLVKLPSPAAEAA